MVNGMGFKGSSASPDLVLAYWRYRRGCIYPADGVRIAEIELSVLAWETYVTFKGIVWILFFTLLVVGAELGGGRSDRSLRTILRTSVIFSTLLIASCMITLVDQVYPALPQELGGFKPRPAVLHLRVSDLSPSLCLALLAHPDGEAAEVSESKEVLVFYADADRLIIKVRPDSVRSRAAEEQVAHDFPLASPAVRRSVATAKLATEVQAAVVYELSAKAVLATTYLK